jgi:hypothetical protein
MGKSFHFQGYVAAPLQTRGGGVAGVAVSDRNDRIAIPDKTYQVFENKQKNTCDMRRVGLGILLQTLR